MKSNIARVVEHIERTGEPWTLYREGKPVAVVVDPHELADLRREVERLSTEGKGE